MAGHHISTPPAVLPRSLHLKCHRIILYREIDSSVGYNQACANKILILLVGSRDYLRRKVTIEMGECYQGPMNEKGPAATPASEHKILVRLDDLCSVPRGVWIVKCMTPMPPSGRSALKKSKLIVPNLVSRGWIATFTTLSATTIGHSCVLGFHPSNIMR